MRQKETHYEAIAIMRDTVDQVFRMVIILQGVERQLQRIESNGHPSASLLKDLATVKAGVSALTQSIQDTIKSSVTLSVKD